MFSIPPAMALSRLPSQISCAADAIACAPEPQTRLTVIAGTATGMPPLIAACRVHPVAGLDDVAHHHAADARGIELGAPQRLANDRGTELGGRRAFQRAVIGSDRSANGVTQDDLSRWHGNILRSVWLSVQGSQIPPDAHYRGIFRLRSHGEAHGTRKSQH